MDGKVMNFLPVARQYVGIDFYREVTFPNDEKFIVACYRAFNAMGLIGPECNGIVILHINKKSILADELAKESTGYFGNSPKQLAEAERICGLSYEDFCAYVNASGRNRYTIGGPDPKKIKFPKLPFKAEQFKATQWDTAEQKARFCRQLAKFILSGYQWEHCRE